MRLIIAAFIPAVTVGPGIGLQGLVMFALYLAGIVSALIAALLLRKTAVKGAGGVFMMEFPKYQWPRLTDVAIGLMQRAMIFLKRAGTIILATTIILWALASFPQAGPGQKQSDVSIAGHIADGIHVIVAPIGFNKDISMALLPAMAAREVAVAAIGTVYSLDAEDETQIKTLEQRLAGRWSLATALAFLVWFIFAPQCISTIAVTRRETNGWRWPIFMVTYLFVLAYIAAGIDILAGGRRSDLADRRIGWRSVNKVILVGNLGKRPRIALVPEWRQSGELQHRHLGKLEGPRFGERKEKTEWHNVVDLFRRAGEGRRVLSAQGLEGLSRRPARNPQMAGPVGYRPLHHRRSCLQPFHSAMVLLDGRGEGGGGVAAVTTVAAEARATISAVAAAAAVRAPNRGRNRRRSTPTSTTTCRSRA